MKFDFRIIPVIDLLHSKAVHAIQGKRKSYQPLKSNLFNTSNPLEIVKILYNKLKFKEIYIADLDSILKRTPNLEILFKILEISDIKVMIDPGITDIEDIYRFSGLKMNKLIIGLETIKSIEDIKYSIDLLGAEKIIVSIDMYKGKIITSIVEWKSQTPVKITSELQKFGINEIILLDLFRVGQKIGEIPDFYLNIVNSFKGKVLIGGGAKDIYDVKKLKDHRFSGVLIATALYDESIRVEDIKKFI